MLPPQRSPDQLRVRALTVDVGRVLRAERQAQRRYAWRRQGVRGDPAMRSRCESRGILRRRLSVTLFDHTRTAVASIHQMNATLLAVSACRTTKVGRSFIPSNECDAASGVRVPDGKPGPDTASPHQTSAMLLVDRASWTRAPRVPPAWLALRELRSQASLRGDAPGPTSPCCRISPRNLEIGITRSQHHARRLGPLLDGCSRGVVE